MFLKRVRFLKTLIKPSSLSFQKDLELIVWGVLEPISLCNTVYKVITKFISKLSARIRLLLPNIISPIQTTFVVGGKDIDNVIISQ